MLVTGEGINVKVIDFGLAKAAVTDAAAHGVNLTQTEDFVGTPAFASPKQFGNSGGVDARSDFYALGATLWYALTGRNVHPSHRFIVAQSFGASPNLCAQTSVRWLLAPPDADSKFNHTPVLTRIFRRPPRSRGWHGQTTAFLMIDSSAANGGVCFPNAWDSSRVNCADTILYLPQRILGIDLRV